MTILKLEVLHVVRYESSCKMLHTFIAMLVPTVGYPTPVTGGEGMIHLSVYGLQCCYRKSHHLLGHLGFQGEGYETAW